MAANARNPSHYHCVCMAVRSSSSFLRFSTLPALLLLLIQLLQCSVSHTAGISLSKNDSNGSHCVVVVEDNRVLKEIGSVWISSDNPCSIHSCEADAGGQAKETISTKECGQFYCEVDSELRPQEGTCCGVCVRSKCLFNGTVYDVGQTWHDNNGCNLLECSQQPGKEPIINAYKKKCPPLPPDCSNDNIIQVDCCPTCKSTTAARGLFDESDDIWTEEFYRKHPCVRECHLDEPPMTCRYTFVVEWYETLSKACYECPNNLTDCQRPHCIVGDGIRRSITVVNRMMPGPAIEVCQNDVIMVDVENRLLGESTTIHWHGMHQRNTPYMDGVPHISQCPISPHSTFRYTFVADNAGTHFWHSHTGMQRGDGVFGALIVRRPKVADPHGHLYDMDLSEHTMLVQDWVHVPGVVMFSSHHHSLGDNKPMNLLMNGKGRYYKAIWEAIKREDREKQQRSGEGTMEEVETDEVTIEGTMDNMETTEEITTIIPENVPTGQINNESVIKNYAPDSKVSLHALDKKSLKNTKSRNENEISRVSRKLPSGDNETIKTLTVEAYDTSTNLPISFFGSSIHLQNSHSTAEAPENLANNTGVPRAKRDIRTIDPDIPLAQVPLHIFNVSSGLRYRFRIINAEFLNCPITISIDNHSLIAISSDGYDFEPVEVGSIVTYAGERFDFVVHANQTPGNYWIRLKGLMDCSERFTSAFQAAILHYDNSTVEEPSGELSYQHQPEGIELNVMNRGPGYVDSLTIAELSALPHYDQIPGVDGDALKPVADYKFFVYYDFYAKDNPVFHPAGYYGFNDTVSKPNRLFTPQLNHISLKFPSMALLPSRDDVDDSMFCNETSLAAAGIDCRKEFCKCHHVLQVPLNSVVELIIVDEGFTFDANHPFHLHGNAFRVVGLERLGQNVTIEMVKQLDRYNLLKRNLVRAPIKDTVTVPDGGYTIVRFEAYNPGFWLFHCHIEFHAEIGMALVLKVGDNDEMLPVPRNFPTCNDYMPDMVDDQDDSSSLDGNDGRGSGAVIDFTAGHNTGSSGSISPNSHKGGLSILLFIVILSITLSYFSL